MTRARNSVEGRQRHRKVLRLAKGYRGARSRTYRSATQAVIRASQNAYRHRRTRKRDFRRLWIVRLNAACRSHGVTYSRFIAALHTAGIDLDRKVLASMAVDEPDAFSTLLNTIGLVSQEKPSTATS